MHPILFEIPGIGFPIRSFGVMVVAGFLLGAHILAKLGLRYAKDPEKELPGYASAPLWALVGVLIGARAMYVIVEVLQGSPIGDEYIENPFKIFAYWEGGLVFYGGLFGGILFGLWCGKRHGLRLVHSLDLAVIGTFVGLAVGRIGCLLVGDDYGRIVPEEFAHLPFPITLRIPEVLPDDSLFGEANAGQLLWATQIWMSVNALLLAGFGRVLLAHRRYPGQVILWSFVLYAITRSLIESFRGDTVRGLWFDGAISTSQIVSIALGTVCLGLLFKNRGRRDALAEATET